MISGLLIFLWPTHRARRDALVARRFALPAVSACSVGKLLNSPN